MQEKMNKNTDISVRILQLIEFVKSNPNDFAKKLGYNRSQTIYDILNNKAKPSYDFFYRLLNSEYSEQINLKWLIIGKDEMIKSSLDEIKTNEPIINYNSKDYFQEKYYQCIEEKTALCDKNQQLYEDVIKLQKEIIQMQRDFMPLKKTPATTVDDVCQV